MSTELRYRPEIDGLRALAVVAVILFHAGFAPFRGGFIGVDVFFAISGFLIGSLILQELNAGTFSFARFYERRARRILPALFVVVLACLPFAFWLMTPLQLDEFAQSVIAVTLFASNIFFWTLTGYFDGDAGTKVLLHTWSLAVEEQFYLVLPPLLLVLWRVGRRAVWGAIAGLALASLLFSQYAAAADPDLNFYGLMSRAWELFAGVLCALMPLAPAARRDNALAWTGLCAIVASVFLLDDLMRVPSLLAAPAVLGTCLVLLFARRDTQVGRLLGARVPVVLGLMSYSAYLWHQPLFAFARIALPQRPGAWTMAMLSVATFALAYLTWQYVEVPWRTRHPLPRFSWRLVAGSAAAVSLGFIVVGTAAAVTGGFYEIKANVFQRAALATATASPRRELCHKNASSRRPDESCRYFGAAGTWAVFGDSHAVELAYAVAEALQPEGDGIRHHTKSGCGPRFGQGHNNACAKWTDETIAYLAAARDVSTVVVSYRLNAHLFGDPDTTYPALPDLRSDDERREMWSSLTAMLRRLVDADKRVVLVLQAPELPRHVHDLVLAERQPGDIKGVTRDWWRRRSAFWFEHVGDIPAGVIVVDPADAFCDAVDCWAVRNGEALYYDNNHMSVRGTEYVVGRMMKKLGPAVGAQNGRPPGSPAGGDLRRGG